MMGLSDNAPSQTEGQAAVQKEVPAGTPNAKPAAINTAIRETAQKGVHAVIQGISQTGTQAESCEGELSVPPSAYQDSACALIQNTSQTGMQPEVHGGTMTMAQAAYQAQTGMQACNAQAEAEADERRREWAKRFRLFGIPTVVYAAVTAFLLYHNFSGIAMTAEAILTVVFAVFMIRRSGRSMCSKGWWILAGILLLGLSDFLTDCTPVQFFNGIGIFLLLLLLLVISFREPEGENFHEMLFELIAAPFRGIGCLGSVVKDTSAFFRTKSKGKKTRTVPVVIGFAAAIPIVLLVIALLCSADAVFKSVLGQVFRDFVTSFILSGIGILISAVFWYAAVYGIVLGVQKPIQRRQSGNGVADAITGIIICLPVTLVYLVFSVIQILFLFLRNMNLPDGYTYAQYVHEGYIQLMVVCLLNLVLVLIMNEIFRKSRILDVLMTVISGCTYIMTASSMLRMIMYIRTYGLTFLRCVVLWVLTLIAVLFAGVLIWIWNRRFRLFRYIMTALIAGWLLFGFAKPDRVVAHYNLYVHEQKADYDYLSRLSADAAPVIFEYARSNGCDGEEYWLSGYRIGNDHEIRWRHINLPEILMKRYESGER